MNAIAEQIPQVNGQTLVARFASRYGVDPNKLLASMRATCFKQRDGEVTNEQMMALLVVADQYKLNPFTKEIFAFPDKGGIVPVVGVDGWSRIINEHPQFDGMDFEAADDGSWLTCVIHRKDRSHPIRVTEYMAEVKRDTQPWKSHPRRMLRHKTLIQCARIAFGFAGIYDEDEAERIVEAEIIADEKSEKMARRSLTDAVLRHADTIRVIKEGIETGNLSMAVEAWSELTQDEQDSIWVAPTKGGPFTTHERTIIKSHEFSVELQNFKQSNQQENQ